MGIQGVPFEPEKKDIKASLKKHDGVLSRVADEFSVERNTLYLYFNRHPDVKAYVDELRAQYIERMCDEAENTVAKLVKRTEDQPAVALKAAQFALNNQAKSRNWNHPEVAAAQAGVGALDKIIDIKIAERRTEAPGASNG